MKRNVGLLVLVAVVGVATAGCGSTNKNVKFNEGYKCAKDTMIKVPLAKNATGKTFEGINVETALTEEMAKALGDEGIRADNTYTGNHLSLPCQITEYEPGSAFKRWLMPGYGSTVLQVKCDLLENGQDNSIGVVEARHTVNAGGAYTIGAWKYVFVNLSKDIAKEIKEKMQKIGQ